MSQDDAARIAANCRHYAMCKIDFLGTGLCPSAGLGNFVTYYPQGRMDVYHALAEGRIPISERLLDIADTCTLCGICDRQCYFVTGLRPMRVMRALKAEVARHRERGDVVFRPPVDDVLADLRRVVGDRWASNDPALITAYSDDPCPLTPPVPPRYVAAPRTAEEVSRIVSICKKHRLPFAIRGNGSSVMGFVMSEGLVIDLNRMREIEVDRDNWVVHVGPGVSAFDLQREARRAGCRVNTAEPSALVAANLICSGIFSLFSATYGIGADNIVDADFIGPDGESFTTNDPKGPNLFSYSPRESPSPGICTRVGVKLHPVLEDEAAVLVPFAALPEALDFARALSVRRIGLAIGIVGGEYIGTFLSPTDALSFRLKEVFSRHLGIGYLVLVIGDASALSAVRNMVPGVIDNRLFRILMLGLPNLVENEWLEAIGEMETAGQPFELLTEEGMVPVLEAALRPCAETLAQAVDEDLRSFFVELYTREEMTDLVWLNAFRILSSRMGRHKHVVAFILYVPLDKPAVIVEINESFKRIGDRYGIRNDYGFITPLDEGKRAVFEYDYYVDQTDEKERDSMRRAMPDVAQMIQSFSQRVTGVRWIRYTLNQGLCRSEQLLYGDGRS